MIGSCRSLWPRRRVSRSAGSVGTRAGVGPARRDRENEAKAAKRSGRREIARIPSRSTRSLFDLVDRLIETIAKGSDRSRHLARPYRVGRADHVDRARCDRRQHLGAARPHRLDQEASNAEAQRHQLPATLRRAASRCARPRDQLHEHPREPPRERAPPGSAFARPSRRACPPLLGPQALPAHAPAVRATKSRKAPGASTPGASRGGAIRTPDPLTPSQVR